VTKSARKCKLKAIDIHSTKIH